MTALSVIVVIAAGLILIAFARDGYRRACPRCKRWRGLRQISRQAAPPTGPVDTEFVRYACRHCGRTVIREETEDDD